MHTPGRRRSSSADGSGSVISSLTRRFVAPSVADRDEPTMNAKQLLDLFTEVRGIGILRSPAKGLLRSSLSDRLTSPPLGVVVAAPMRMVRFFDILNTPIAVLGLSIVVVVVNVFVYFDYYSKTPTPLPTERTAPSATTLERTERAGPKEKTLPEVTRTERTRPSTTLQSTTPTAQSATVSATSSPSP
jgi:hypothetical protein